MSKSHRDWSPRMRASLRGVLTFHLANKPPSRAVPLPIDCKPRDMTQRMLAVSWLAVVLIGVLEFKVIQDTDIFWQVRLGQLMLEEGRIPQFDRFTFTHFGEPVPAIYCLSQLLYAFLYDMGGWQLTRLVHHLTLVGALLVAAASCRRQVTRPFSVAVAMTIGFVVMLSNADLRPQSFGLLGFAMLLALARGGLPFRFKLIAVTIVLVAWQNMHPSIIVGTVAIGALAVADFLDRKPDRGSPWELIVLALLPMILQFATPVGGHILDVSRANLRISRDLLRIEEWLPPWDPSVFVTVNVYWVVLLGSFIAAFALRDRFSVRDLTLLIAMTLLSSFAARFIIFWAIALVPFWAELVERLVPDGMFAPARGGVGVHVRTFRSLIGLAAVATIVVCLHPARFGPILRPGIPIDGVKMLRAQLPGPARIYNARVWAGPLLLDGDPAWRVSVDGRLYFFRDPAEWRAMDDARAGRITLDELERRHHPDAFFLYPAGDQALIDSLSVSPRWRACFRGPTCVAFVRARP